MKSDFLVALTQLAAERNLPREIVLSAIETALASAYRKDGIADEQDISVKLDTGTGEVLINVVKTVVDEITHTPTQILLNDALKLDPNATIDGIVATEKLPYNAGRIAAQTAKQVVLQRLREAERELVFTEFSDREGEIFSGTVQTVEFKQVVVDLGRAESVLPASEQSPFERYRPGMKLKVVLESVSRNAKGPELIISRASNVLVSRLFEMEVPEIYSGAVEIVSIARDPGYRTKVSVRAKQDGVDPVGSCVGLRGIRIQNIVSELQGEKIDVVEWNKEAPKYIANALSPSQVMHVNLDTTNSFAEVVVPDRQLSLAIGKDGQNARLASRLTGWSIDIRSNLESETKLEPTEYINHDSGLEKLGLSARPLTNLKNAGLNKVGDVIDMTKDQILEIKGFGEKSYSELEKLLKTVDIGHVQTVLEKDVSPTVSSDRKTPSTKVGNEALDKSVEESTLKALETDADTTKKQPESELDEKSKTSSVDDIPVEPDKLPELVTSKVPVAESKQDEQLAATVINQKPIDIPELSINDDITPAITDIPDTSESISDLSDDIWSVKRAVTESEPGQIRFAEDIVGLRGGITARRSQTRNNESKGRKRKAGKNRLKKK